MECCNTEERLVPPEKKITSCVDAGSENCPCYLAVTGDCLVCSRLQGEDHCSCEWPGVCIYNEFIQGNRKVSNPRREFDAPIVQRKFYQDDLVVYILDVGKGFAMKADRPGSYLFIRGSEANSFYDFPISVMQTDVEKGQIHLGIRIISAKTKILLTERSKLVIRGPYRNGLHGIASIMNKKGKNQNTLIIARGIGIAPGILASKALAQRGSVDMIIDTEKISRELIEDYVGDQKEIRFLSLAEKASMKELTDLMRKKTYDNVILLVSDHYIDQLGRMVKKILPAADLAASNNFRICCGEGLCGSCSVSLPSGDTMKMCKCQVNGEDFLSRVFYAETHG
jgi:hypothetical protein